MFKKKMLLLILAISLSANVQSVTAASVSPVEKDNVEWIALWQFPQNREDRLERMLVVELQRKILYGLQQRHFVKPGKDVLYSFEPFKVIEMQEDHGISKLIVIAIAQQEKPDVRNKEKYKISFVHDYEKGFVISDIDKLE
ncbi:hypothetical protein DFQ01_110122 [Paenibacillus cellulosilyticus]|uniref:Conjugative transposon protein TcpC n=1 Tax=Paenibacillus cellulosilyticus TaxID=375489 RepID=A0A2V2YSM9_9BACL|nr:hypothetical protein [Paenibacillus cellulosilyticus]PWW01232.1 hypothetical protein DFQ01_110122 [Paenibacillus cellulosilyticus]